MSTEKKTFARQERWSQKIDFFFYDSEHNQSPTFLIEFIQAILAHQSIIEKTLTQFTHSQRTRFLQGCYFLMKYLLSPSSTLELSEVFPTITTRQGVSLTQLKTLEYLWEILTENASLRFTFSLDELQAAFSQSKNRTYTSIYRRALKINRLREEGLSDKEIISSLNYSPAKHKVDLKVAQEWNFSFPQLEFLKIKTENFIDDLNNSHDAVFTQTLLDQVDYNLLSRNIPSKDTGKFLFFISNLDKSIPLNQFKMRELVEILKARGIPIGQYHHSQANGRYYFTSLPFIEKCIQELKTLMKEMPAFFAVETEVVRGPKSPHKINSHELLRSKKYISIFPLLASLNISLHRWGGEKILDLIPEDCPFTIIHYRTGYYVSSQDRAAFIEYLKEKVSESR